ncbi:hypothetical protein LCGC14_3056610, partial [marine sediment metagenome]
MELGNFFSSVLCHLHGRLNVKRPSPSEGEDSVNIDPVEALVQLIATASVNPMGGPISGPPLGECRLSDHLESVFRGLSLVVERQQVAEGRENVIARLDGEVPPERGGKLILFDANQDT